MTDLPDVIASALRSAKQSRENIANSWKAKFIFLNNRYVRSGLLRATKRARNDSLLGIFLSLLLSSCAFAASTPDDNNVLNLYTWSAVIPNAIIYQFEKETGIKVNFSTYDSNEMMYAKLTADPHPVYDVVEPSSYYVDRMRRKDMLLPLDKKKLPEYHNLDKAFLNQKYDPHSRFSIPFIWGVTGIFATSDNSAKISGWADLWDKKYRDSLVLLDEQRDIFSAPLKILGYSCNDENPEHIREAYEKLRQLLPNIKLYKSGGMISILADEDAKAGFVWNGDLYKASLENPRLRFIYPKEGFAIWVDTFAIPKNAPHAENAYRFLNFIMRADVVRAMALENSYATANLAGRKLLPAKIRNNLVAYPTADILKRGEFQTYISEDAVALYEKYWEKLKMGE